MTDGTRTRDVQDHNLALYQLSYGHHDGSGQSRRPPLMRADIVRQEGLRSQQPDVVAEVA